MWVFDGEQWAEEGNEHATSSSSSRPRYDRSVPEMQVIEYPELQVIEITPTPYTDRVPPFPLP